MSSCSKLESHPNKSLERHLLNVANLSKDIFLNLKIDNNELYGDLAFNIGLCHDFAKSTSFFQEKLHNKIQTKKANHGFLSAIFGYYVIQQLFDENFYDFDFPTITFIVIARHHGNLKNIMGANGLRENIEDNGIILNQQLTDLKENTKCVENSLNLFYSTYGIDLNDFFKNFDNVIADLRSSLFKLSLKRDIENYLIILLFYSVLLDSDKMDASETNLFDRVDLSNDLVDNYKHEKFGNNSEGINKIREDAYQEVINNLLNQDLVNKIFSIDLPTGTGKTLTAFSAALKLRNKIKNELNFTPKIIYSLPFLSIIDQNERVFNNVLIHNNLGLYESNEFIGSNVLLKHNYLSDMSYKIDCTYYSDIPCDGDIVPINNSRILIEGWNSEIIITTFIQFFYSLIGNRNRSLRKFHNITNSIIILDEIQAVPYKFWPILNEVISKFSEMFNSWFILMTATQPLIFNESNNEIFPLVENRVFYYSNFDRIDYSFNLDKLDFADFKDKIMKEIISEDSKNFMIVLNTVNSSKELYDYIKQYFLDEGLEVELDSEDGIVYVGENIQLVYLSTNIIPKHRLNRIKKIKSNKRTIIVTTQLVEAGVDISVDIIYRDFAPLDSIIQTAGRCNRNDDGIRGMVNVVYLLDDSKENKRPFSSYVYNSVLLDATKEVIESFNSECHIISEKDFNLNASHFYYLKLLENGSDEDSGRLLNILEKLYFSKIKDYFELIEETNEKIDVFIEIDDDAKSLWEDFIDIQEESDPIKRKDNFSKIKSKFYEYIISVDVNKLGTISIEGWIAYISQDDINRKYNIENGFIPRDEESVFII